MRLVAAFRAVWRVSRGLKDCRGEAPVASGSRLEIEGLIGFFFNTLVLKTDLSGDPSFRDLLRRVRGVALGAYAHQDLPFEKLVEELRPPRDLSRTALFQVMVAHAGTPSLRLEGLSAEFVDIDDGISKFDLTLEVDDSRERLACALEYSTDLFDAATAGRMLRQLETLLQGIAASPDSRLSRLSLLPEEERRQVVVEWSGTRGEGTHGEGPRDRAVHELFAIQAARAPEAIAASAAGRRPLHRDLRRRAPGLARP